MTDLCACRVTPRERFENPDCPIHGVEEMRRRHEAAPQQASSPLANSSSSSPRGRNTAQILHFRAVGNAVQSHGARGDRKTMPIRPRNAEFRAREYLTSDEINALVAAARGIGRHGHRDATLILMGFRHGLRVAEFIALHWSQVDLKQGLLHVRRVKNGTPATHPLKGPEIRALRRLRREYPDGPYVLMTERKAPLTASTVRHIVKRAGKQAGFEFPVHPHMLRHSCGFYLANIGVDTRAIQCYLGHRSISNTVIYTQLSPQRFNEFWSD